MTQFQFRDPDESELATIRAFANLSEDMGGELMVFSDAVLARAEVNKNRDQIDPQGISELAATIGLMPLDDEHIENKIIGLFTTGRVAENGTALSVDGFTFARRFPAETADVIAGRKRLSIEADISTAKCSICGGEFKRRREYCAHLKDPLTYGAVRILRGLKAVGGGITREPAGTDTDFSRERGKMRFVASESDPDGALRLRLSVNLLTEPGDDPDGILEPELQDDVPGEIPDSQEPEKHEMDELQNLQQQVAEQLVRLQEMEASLTASNALVATLTQERDVALSASQSAAVSRDRYVMLLKAGFQPEEIDPIVERLAATDEAVLNLLIANRKQTVSASVNQSDEADPPTEGQVQNSPKKELVMGDDNAPPTGTGIAPSWGDVVFVSEE